MDGGGEGSEVAAPIAADILRAYFKLPPDSALAAPAQGIAPPAGAPPPKLQAAPARKFQGRLVGVDPWGELPGIFGTVVDASGRAVSGVRVVADKCDGGAVFTSITDGNGAFNFSGVYWKDSLRWCARVVAPLESEAYPIPVAPYYRYTIQFVPSQ